MSDYSKYRGKCKEFVDALIKKDPSLIAVRGHYIDVLWGKQQHWWCKTPEGNIIDPTCLQFPTKGTGKYVEFDGMCTCSECGKQIPEEETLFMGNYQCCSDKCCRKLVGLK